MARKNRFTIYDALEAAGHFENNPANAGARDTEGRNLYSGPVEYPKMLYHPTGLERVTVPAEVIVTPLGPKEVGEQRELVFQIVQSKEEELALRAEGWHLTAAKAIAAAKDPRRPVPAMNAIDRVAELEAELAALRAERDAEQELEAKLIKPSVAKPLSAARTN